MHTNRNVFVEVSLLSTKKKSFNQTAYDILPRAAGLITSKIQQNILIEKGKIFKLKDSVHLKPTGIFIIHPIS
jgi:hypothetical protein